MVKMVWTGVDSEILNILLITRENIVDKIFCSENIQGGIDKGSPLRRERGLGKN